MLHVYVFFATWCVPCRQELPALAELARRYDPAAIEFVLVAEDASSSRDEVPRFLRRVGARGRLLYDDDSRLLERFNPSASLPFLAVVDAAGRVVWSHRGYEPGDEDELARVLDRAVRAPVASGPAARVASQVLGVWRGDDFVGGGGDDATLAVTRLDGELRSGGWRAAARVDGAWVDTGRGEGDARPERVAVHWTDGRWWAAAGDAYVAQGHGLTLSMRKLDPIGTDTSLQGLHGGFDGARLRAQLHAGRVNPQNVDALTYRVFDDPDDVVGGLAVEVDVGDGVTLSQAGSVFRLDRAAFDGADVELGLAGTGLRVRRGALTARAELAGLRRRDGEGARWGGGGFGSASLTAGRWIMTLEAKLYRRFAVERTTPVQLAYHEPPTLERNDQEVPGNTDAAGGRAAVQRVTTGSAITASLLAYRFARDGGSPLDGGRAAHGYVTLEQRAGDAASWAVSLGGRDEREPDGALGLRFAQAGADVAVRLPRRVGLTAKWDHRFEQKTVFGGAPGFIRGSAVASAAWASRVTASAIYGYSTEAAARPVHYPAAEVRLALGRHGELRVLGGRLAGGRLCVGGSCRDVPPFEGVRADLLLQASW